jgi:YVTN family beta-propeller protein
MCLDEIPPAVRHRRPFVTCLLMLCVSGLSVPALCQTRDYAYVAMPDRTSISVLDTVTQTFVTTINVGAAPGWIVISPDRTRAYVMPQSFQTLLTVVDTATDRVRQTIALGGEPTSMAFTPSGRFAYVSTYTGAEQDHDTVSVIDTDPASPQFHTIVATLDVDKTAQGIAISPDGTRAFLAGGHSHAVSVIDTTDPLAPSVAGTIDFGNGEPVLVAFAPDGTFAYVMPSVYGAPRNVIWVIDPVALTIASVIELPMSVVPSWVVFSADGTHAYVATVFDDIGGGAGLAEIDTATQTVLRGRGFADATAANAVALTTDGSQAYVTGADLLNGRGNAVWIVDTTTFELVATKTLAAWPAGIAVATLSRPATPRVAYVANGGDGSVSVIDTDTLRSVATIPVGGGPRGVAFDPDASHAYVADGDVIVIDVATNTVVDRITVTTANADLVVSPDGVSVFVASTTVPSISVIDTTTHVVTDVISIGRFSTGIAVTPDGSRVYVGANSAVVVIDTASKAVVDSIPISGPLQGVAITPDGKLAYVADLSSSDVFVIDTDPSSPTFDTVVARVSTGPYGSGNAVAISPDGAFAYVVNESLGTASRIRTATQQAEARISVGSNEPQGIGISRGGTLAFVTNTYAATVTVIDTTTDRVVAIIPVRGGPWGVAAR